MKLGEEEISPSNALIEILILKKFIIRKDFIRFIIKEIYEGIDYRSLRCILFNNDLFNNDDLVKTLTLRQCRLFGRKE